MKRNPQIPILIATALLSLSTWCVPNAFGDGNLAAIPLLGTDTSNEARAITSDGAFVVGLSSATNGFLYNATNGYLVQPVSADGYPAQSVTGVGYRTDTNQSPAQPQLVLSGLTPYGGKNYFASWMTADGGTNWDYAYQTISTGAKNAMVPLANGLAGTTWDVCFVVWTDEGTAKGDNWGIDIGQFSGLWIPTSAWDSKAAGRPNVHQMNGIASNGRAVGWRTVNMDTSPSCYLDIADWNGTGLPTIWGNGASGPWGLDGTTAGQAYSVSPDGTNIFGVSPKGGTTMPTNFPFKATFTTNFPGPATQLSTNPLPVFADSTAVVYTVNPYPTNPAISTNIAVPYGCTPDGKSVVGVNYRSGIEKAVLWDTSAANPASWTVTDLTALAAANGILGNFTNLTCAYSIATNATGGKVVVGKGYYSEDAGVTVNIRGFVMTVPTSSPFVRPSVSISTSPQKYTFTVASVTGKTYYLEYTTVLPAASWTTIGAGVPGTGSPITLTDLNPADAKRFYRIRIQ